MSDLGLRSVHPTHWLRLYCRKPLKEAEYKEFEFRLSLKENSVINVRIVGGQIGGRI